MALEGHGTGFIFSMKRNTLKIFKCNSNDLINDLAE